MTADAYRRRAEDCLKLAQECPEADVREALEELAGDFLREAQELADQDSRPRWLARV